MKLKLLMAWSIIVASSASAKSKEVVPVDPGTPPASVEEFQRLATPALLSGFFDPGAAQITWDMGITGGYWKPPLSKKIPGWFTCGLVNGKNRMGGYVGARRFVVVYNSGQIAFSAVGDGGTYDFVSMGCQNAINQGVLKPAGAVDHNTSPKFDPNTPRLGIAFTIVPDGAYINFVDPSSPASKAGLVTGLVISHINALPIKGFDEATVGKLLSAGSKMKFSIIGKGDVVVEKALPGA